MGIVREALRSPADLPVLVQAKVCALPFDWGEFGSGSGS
jgi:hypothetical protein